MQEAKKTRKRFMAAAVLAGGLGLFSVSRTMTEARGDWVGGLRSRLDALTGEPQFAPDAVAPEGVVAEGRLATYPGAEVVVAADLTGRVLRVPVTEGQVVRKGDLIAELEGDEARASLQETQWRVAEVDAEIRLLEWKVQHVGKMVESSAASVREAREAHRDLEAARARRHATAALATRIEAQIAKLRIVSPIDGTVVARSVHPGQMVAPLTPVVTVVDLGRVRVDAEVNEFDGGRVVPGAAATVTAEGYPGQQWRAVVEEIPSTVVNRQMRPQDPGRPSDTGVVVVKLALLDPTPLRLGQRVEVRIGSAPARQRSADVARHSHTTDSAVPD